MDSKKGTALRYENFSHDIRSPMNVILGWVRLLQAGELDARLREKALAAIEKNAREQSRLLEELSAGLGLNTYAVSSKMRPKPKPLPKGWNFDPSEALRGVRVLIVDDHLESRRYFRAALKQRGASVRSLPSPEKVVDVIENWRPHVLLGNLQMPGENGISLIRRVREMPEDRGGTIPAAMLTGMNTPEVRKKALAAGYHTFLAKPVEPLDLVLVVAKLAVLGVSA